MNGVRPALFALALVGASASAVAEAPADLLAPARVQAGQALFSESCSYCHGENGIGGASGAPSLQARKDLGPDDLYATITSGRINGMNIMPAWGDALTEEQRWTLVGYIRSMAGR